jgi:hypothetical protein
VSIRLLAPVQKGWQPELTKSAVLAEPYPMLYERPVQGVGADAFQSNRLRKQRYPANRDRISRF